MSIEAKDDTIEIEEALLDTAEGALREASKEAFAAINGEGANFLDPE